jgi:hypothetical protein
MMTAEASMQLIWKYHRAALVVLFFSIGACVSILQPKLPQGAEEMSPPAVYSRWWQMTQACSGRSRDIASIEWYRTPGQSFAVNDQQGAGLWLRNRIVIAGDAVYEGQVVRHEMLHALLGTSGHPREAFLGACASIVTCLPNCVQDAGSWTAPSQYERLNPDSMDVSANVEITPTDVDGERWLLAWIRVHNRRDRAVLITAPGDPRTPNTFAYQIWGQFGAIQKGIQRGIVAFDSSTLFFAPSETKQWLFEFRRGPMLSQYTTPVLLPPGAYTVRGAYADHWSTEEKITLTP